MKMLRSLRVVALCIALTACLTPVSSITVETPPLPMPASTVAPSPTPRPAPSPTAIPDRTLTICAGSEPAGLYLYAEGAYIKDLILEAVYDGPIDSVNYRYQPVILEKLPSLADGDAVISPVTVGVGDRVVDSMGNVVTLTVGVRVRPSGCQSAGCEVAFERSPIEMDQMQATFRMKDGIRWSDGEPLTASDSVYSFNLARDPDTAHYGGYTPYIEERTARYVAPNQLTTVWIGLPGFLDQKYFLRFWTPLPRHVWSRYDPAEMPELEAVIRTPIGYGPYVIDKWVPGERIESRINAHYFRAAEGRPYFDRLVIRFVYPAAKGIDMLVTGKCDILTLDMGLEDQIDRLRELDQAGQLRLYSVAGQIWEHLTFGINPAPGYDRPNFFEDVRLRQAFAYCIDRQRLADEILNGLSVAADSYIPPNHPLYAGDALTRYPFDPARGQALLEDVGWRDEDGDGVREAHGVPEIEERTPLQFRYETRSNSVREKVTHQVTADLAACGVRAEVGFHDSSFFADGPEGLVFGRRFDLAEFAWLITDDTSPCSLYETPNIPSAENDWKGDNAGGYHNPDYDAACVQAMTALPGTEAYTHAHREAQRIFSQDLPALPLFLRLRFAAARPDLRGLILDPITFAETWNIEAFTLEP